MNFHYQTMVCWFGLVLFFNSPTQTSGGNLGNLFNIGKKHNIGWLVVSTILKNISQWEGLSHTLWKNKKCSKPPTRINIRFFPKATSLRKKLEEKKHVRKDHSGNLT
jgi:hypothetical protein